MSRKIRLVGLGIVVAVLIAGLIAVCVVSSNKIGTVSNLEATSSSQNSVELNWKRVGSSEGYYVYQKTDSEYEKIATIEDNNECTFIIENLQDTTIYNFHVTAYKTSGDKIVESEKYTDVSICTSPADQEAKVVASGEGKVTVSWIVNERATGYEIQYSKSNDFSDLKSEAVTDNATSMLDIPDLDTDVDYYFRVRSYINYDGSNVVGNWSATVTQKVVQKASSSVDTSKPMIAITFDDGPTTAGSSTAILDTIEKYGVKATFFMVGKNASGQSENVKRKVSLGCEIGNHTYDHKNYGKNVTASDISSATDAISAAGGGVKVTCFRSPGGNTTSLIRDECKKEGMPLYYWSLDTQDWKSRDAQKVYDAVMNNVKDGDIILMHEIYDTTAEAFERMVPELLAQGYQLVTCSELVKAKTGSDPVPGEQYVNGQKINNSTS